MSVQNTIICIDNSEFARNGDFFPNRLGAQLEVVNIILTNNLRGNPQNKVALLTMAGFRPEVLVPLCSQQVILQKKLYSIRIGGTIDPWTTLRIAQFVFKHQKNRHHAQRVVVFIGSPLWKDRIKGVDRVALGHYFQKANVNVDFVAFGTVQEVSSSSEFLKPLVDALIDKGELVTLTSNQSCNLSNVILRQVSSINSTLPNEEMANDDSELRFSNRMSLQSTKKEQLRESAIAIGVNHRVIRASKTNKVKRQSNSVFKDTEMELRKIRSSNHYKGIKSKVFSQLIKQSKVANLLSLYKFKDNRLDPLKSVNNQSMKTMPKNHSRTNLQSSKSVLGLTGNSSRSSSSLSTNLTSSSSLRARIENANLQNIISKLAHQKEKSKFSPRPSILSSNKSTSKNKETNIPVSHNPSSKNQNANRSLLRIMKTSSSSKHSVKSSKISRQIEEMITSKIKSLNDSSKVILRSSISSSPTGSFQRLIQSSPVFFLKHESV